MSTIDMAEAIRHIEFTISHSPKSYAMYEENLQDLVNLINTCKKRKDNDHTSRKE